MDEWNWLIAFTGNDLTAVCVFYKSLGKELVCKPQCDSIRLSILNAHVGSCKLYRL
jgi:hypothetical protein